MILKVYTEVISWVILYFRNRYILFLIFLDLIFSSVFYNGLVQAHFDRIFFAIDQVFPKNLAIFS